MALALAAATGALSCRAEAPSPAPGTTTVPTEADFNRLAARVDPFVEKNRVLVLTDIANEPDDQMSMVRFLVYANEFDVEGLVATTSTWMRSRVRPDAIHKVLDAYESVYQALSGHAPGYPTAASLRTVVTTGLPTFGMSDPQTSFPGPNRS